MADGGKKMRSLALLFWLIAPVMAQSPSGTVTGSIADSSGAVMAGTSVIVTNRGTGMSRSTRTGPEGIFAVPALPPGDYEVLAEMSGFQAVVRDATVAAGTTTTVNMTMQVGGTSEAI